VVVRAADGRAEVVLVHRPRYDDWSLPKGKPLDGESPQDTALREVLEESGLVCRILGELPSTSYVTSEGTPKVVRYWVMRPVGDTELEPTREVDEARWLPVDEAIRTLSNGRDRELVASVSALAGPAYLLRHAKAGNRSAWPGDDGQRPLSKAGRRQARGLVRWFADRPIDRILSSPAVRCVESVQPLAERRGVEVELREELAEGADLSGLLGLLDDLASAHAVLCAHGDLIPALVEEAERSGAAIDPAGRSKKGSIWIMERDAGVFVRARYVPPPEAEPTAPARRRAWRQERR
jgi:8-oxo-dGTP diphosphatase